MLILSGSVRNKISNKYDLTKKLISKMGCFYYFKYSRRIWKKDNLGYTRMLYISYGSVCELETQILLTGDLYLIKKGELSALNKDIAEIERMLKALIKSLENKPSNPCLPCVAEGEAWTPGILGPSSPTKLEKTYI